MSRPQVRLALAAAFFPLALLCLLDRSTTAGDWIGRDPMVAIALLLAVVAVARSWLSEPMRTALLPLPLAVVFLWRLSVMARDQPGAHLFMRWTDAQFWADETTVALVVAGLGDGRKSGLALVHTEARRLWVVSRTGAMDAGVVALVTLVLVAARANRSRLVLFVVGLSVVGLAGRGGLARRAGLSALVTTALLVPLEAQSRPLPTGMWPTPFWVGDGHLTPDLLTVGIGLLFSLAVVLQGPIEEERTSGSWLGRFGLPVWIVCGVVASTGALENAYSERAAPGWTSLERLAPLAPVATCEGSLFEGGEQWLLEDGTARKVLNGRRSGAPYLVAPPSGRMGAVFSLAGGPLASARLVVRAGSAAGAQGLRVCPIEVHSFVGRWTSPQRRVLCRECLRTRVLEGRAQRAADHDLAQPLA